MGCCQKQCVGKRTTFVMMMFLTTSFFFVEIIVGYMTNSMALVADSFHMLSDILSLFIGFFALKYSKKAPGINGEASTYGFVRAEVLGALVNSVFLLALCFSIFVESFKRMIELDTIKDPILVLIVGGVGLFINVIGLFFFQGHAHSHGGGGHTHGGGGHGHSHAIADESEDELRVVVSSEKHPHSEDNHGHSHDDGNHGQNHSHGHENKAFRQDSEVVPSGDDKFTTIDLVTENQPKDKKKVKKAKSGGQMNMKGVYLHILGDALGSVIVIIAALVIHYFDGEWTLYVDPGLSIVIVLIILKTTIPLLKESSKILLQYAPSHIQLNKLQEKMLIKFPVIENIHEFHIWQLTGNKVIASVHIQFSSYADYKILASSIKEFFHHEGIHSTTIQPEFIEEIFEEGVTSDEKQCLLKCESNSCEEKLCCGSIEKSKKSLRKRAKALAKAAEGQNNTECAIQEQTSDNSSEDVSIKMNNETDVDVQINESTSIDVVCSESTKL